MTRYSCYYHLVSPYLITLETGVDEIRFSIVNKLNLRCQSIDQKQNVNGDAKKNIRYPSY